MKTYRKSLELYEIQKCDHIAETKYESYTKILESLKNIKLCFCEIKITDISVVKDGK